MLIYGLVIATVIFISYYLGEKIVAKYIKEDSENKDNDELIELVEDEEKTIQLPKSDFSDVYIENSSIEFKDNSSLKHFNKLINIETLEYDVSVNINIDYIEDSSEVEIIEDEILDSSFNGLDEEEKNNVEKFKDLIKDNKEEFSDNYDNVLSSSNNLMKLELENMIEPEEEIQHEKENKKSGVDLNDLYESKNKGGKKVKVLDLTNKNKDELSKLVRNY